MVLKYIYILILDTLEWKKFNITPSPSIRLGHTVTYNPTSSEIYLFGGMNNTEVYNDLWRFNCCSLTWEKITDDEKNAPKGRSGHTAVIDSNNLYIFGGMQNNPPHVFEDINLYSICKYFLFFIFYFLFFICYYFINKLLIY